LQGVDGFPNQLPELFRRVRMIHAYVLTYHRSFFNTVESSFII
jgi:hypothetical protein